MSEQIAQFQPFERDNKFFVKAFLLDASVNLNKWGVTERALLRDLQSFKGKPFVVTSEFDHPDEKEQEKFRKGTIQEVGIDETSGKAFAVIEIEDKETEELIKNGTIRFVSPSIGVEPEDATRVADREVIDRFEGYHLAGVKEPAFGVVKAQIKGQCTGTAVTCSQHLKQVQASIPNSSLSLPSKNNLLMAEGQPIQAQTVDYSAQIKELTASVESLKKGIETRDETIAQLNSKIEAEIKRPYIARILTAKQELGEIKAEEQQAETEKLSKIDANTLQYIASTAEGAVKNKTAAIAAPTRSGYRIQANASANTEKYDETKVRQLLGGRA